MSFSNADLRQVLRSKELSFVDNPSSDGVVVPVPYEDENLLVAIEAEGMIVQFRSVQLATDEGRTHRRELLTTLLDWNHQGKVLKWAYDDSDGEVVAYADMFIGQGTMTEQQVMRCLAAFLLAAKRRDRVRTILSSGRDPGDPS